MQHLSIPEAVERNPEAVEIVRAWALPSDEVGFVTTAFPVTDPAAIGIFFADLARHYFAIANVGGGGRPKYLRRVAEGLLAEADAEELALSTRYHA